MQFQEFNVVIRIPTKPYLTHANYYLFLNTCVEGISNNYMTENYSNMFAKNNVLKPYKLLFLLSFLS